MARVATKEKFDWSKAKPLPRGKYAKRGVRMPLRAVREAVELTQADIARAAGIDQSEVSRIERRDDVMVSTLARYAKALGGRLDLVLTFGDGHRMIVDMPGPEEPMSHQQAKRWIERHGAAFTMHNGGPTGQVMCLELGADAVQLAVPRNVTLEQALPRLVGLLKERIGTKS